MPSISRSPTKLSRGTHDLAHPPGLKLPSRAHQTAVIFLLYRMGAKSGSFCLSQPQPRNSCPTWLWRGCGGWAPKPSPAQHALSCTSTPCSQLIERAPDPYPGDASLQIHLAYSQVNTTHQVCGPKPQPTPAHSAAFSNAQNA